MNRRVLRSRARRTAQQIATTTAFWVVTDLAGCGLGWSTVLACIITAIGVVGVQASLAYVDHVDRRERARNNSGRAASDTGP